MTDPNGAPEASPAALSMDAGTVVTTSLQAVQRDTRMFQIGASFRRFGYRSIVVEGERSELDRDKLPFELITLEGAGLPEVAAKDPRGAQSDGHSLPLAEALPTRSHSVVEAMPRSLAAAVRRLATPLSHLRLLGARLWSSEVFLWARLVRANSQPGQELPPADLYYLNFITHSPAVWKACRRHGATFIYESQDAHWAWPAYQELPALYRLWLYSVERRSVRRAFRFITVSEGVADLYERRYGRRPTLLRNTHDLRVDEDADLDVRRAAGLGEDAFLLVVAGNDKPSDTIAEPLQAMTRLPDRVHLALLGRGWEQHEPMARELGLQDRVHVLPPVPPTKVTSTIRTADTALINIRTTDVHINALPTRFFHAVSAGLPILYPPLPAVRTLAESYRLGLPIDAEDPESIASAVRTLSDDPELADEFRTNVREAREVLNWEHEESHLAEIAAKAMLSQR